MAMQQRAASFPLPGLIWGMAWRGRMRCGRVMIVGVHTVEVVIIEVLVTLVAARMGMHDFLRHAGRQQGHHQQRHGPSAPGTVQSSKDLLAQ